MPIFVGRVKQGEAEEVLRLLVVFQLVFVGVEPPMVSVTQQPIDPDLSRMTLTSVLPFPALSFAADLDFFFACFVALAINYSLRDHRSAGCEVIGDAVRHDRTDA